METTAMSWGSILNGLNSQPFILLFLVVAAGYALGRMKVKGIGLGATASTLVLSLGLSLWAAHSHGIQFKIPDFASTLFFNLFMFSVGMKVGPQFVSGLRRDAKQLVFLGLLIPALSLALIFLIRAIFHPAPGIVPGIFAGANTATPGLGAAQEAYQGGAGKLPAGASVDEAIANLSTAFAFAYCISMVLFIMMTRVPDMFGAKTPAAAKAFEASIKTGTGAELPGTVQEFFSTSVSVPTYGLRTYKIERPEVTGILLKDLREQYPLVAIERIVRDGKIVEPKDGMALRLHDAVTVSGEVPRLVSAGTHLGPEVDDREARDVGGQTVDFVLQDRRVIDRTLGDLAKDAGHGLYLNAMFRGGIEIPAGPDTVLRKGDTLRVTGSQWRINDLAKQGARVIRPSLATDIVTLALGLTLGALVGTITIPVAGVRMTVGAAVGLLLVGIGLSTLRTRYPFFGGPYPEPARQLLEDLGLNIFIAILGINSGAGVIKAVSQGAIAPIVVGCLVVGFVPAIVAWFAGSGPMKMNRALLLGAVSGGRCNSAGMRASQETTQSTVPAISYPVTFAISNIVLTFLAYVMAMVG
jgi:putative transport protein